MPTKLILEKQFKEYYTATSSPEVLSFGKVPYITIEGKGEPAGKEFTKAVEALYPLAYGIKNICKKAGKDFGVPKLEGLWWVESGKNAVEIPRSEWFWRLLIRMPHYVTAAIVKSGKEEVFEKKKLALIENIELEVIDEGRCVQVLHVGSYSTELNTIQAMKNFMHLKRLKEHGLHHEIYLSDPRKTVPEKLKTILRQPVK